MRVMLVSINKLRSYRPVLPIAVATLAAQARRHGHAVRCVDLMFEEDDEGEIRRQVADFQPHVVGISIRNVDSLNFLEPAVYTPLAVEVAEWARAERPGVQIVLGGAGFTTVPEDLMDFVAADYGLVGFAEESFPELLAALERGEEPDTVDGILIPRGGTYLRRAPVDSIDYAQVAEPDRSFYDPRYFTYTFETHDEIERVAATLQTKKGCVLECIFCSNFLIDGTGVKLKDVRQVVDEVELIAEEGYESFEIVDGVFNLPLHFALDVLREMKRRGLDLPWSCMVNPGAVNEELVELMARTGCREVELGTDSACDRILAGLGKNFRQRRILEVHRMLRDAGLRTMHCLFIGSPGDNRESVFETFDVMDELVGDGCLGARVYWTFGLRICRETGLHRLAVQEGMIRNEERFLVPKYYVAPAVIDNPALLDDIQDRVLANRNWYLWWGLRNITLRERIRQARQENARIEESILRVLETRAPRTMPFPVAALPIRIGGGLSE